MTATSSSDPTSTRETLPFFNTIPKCAEILAQPDLRVIHPRNPDAFFHSTLRTNNSILKSIFIYQPAHPRTSSDSNDTDTRAATNPHPQEQERKRERGYLLLHLGAGVSGQPDIAHGGFLATVLDQVTGTLIRASGLDRGRGAVTVYLNVNYQAPVKVPGVVVARAEIGRVEGRKIFVVGEIFVAEADGGG
ncbi:alpha-1,3/1,6-mannosyltransferase alg-2, partial [Aspergillus lentulus]